MTEWRDCKFGEIATFSYGKMPNKKNIVNCGYPIFSGYKIVGYYNSYMYEDPQLIIVARGVGGTGDVKISPPKSYITNLSIIAEVHPGKANKKFLYYYFKINNLRELDSGSAQSQITINDLNNYCITLPPLPEQKAIAEVLSSFDDKIDLLIRQNKTLEDLAQAYFRKWFIEDIHNKICYKRFADVAEFSKGKKPREIIEEQRKGYVRQILIDTFDTDKEYYTRPEGMIISTETDILMVMDGASSGRVEIGFSGVVGSTIGMFRPKSDFKYPMFLYEFLKSNEEFIMDNTTGSAIPHADKKLIFELEIPYFQEEKIQEFENFALVLFNKRQNNRRQIRTLTKLRDTLLPKLISGEIRVKM
jgi:type I restriction enzyme S subunit